MSVSLNHLLEQYLPRLGMTHLLELGHFCRFSLRTARFRQSALTACLVFDHSEQVFSITREVQNDVVMPRVDCPLGLNCGRSVRIQEFSPRRSAEVRPNPVCRFRYAVIDANYVLFKLFRRKILQAVVQLAARLLRNILAVLAGPNHAVYP